MLEAKSSVIVEPNQDENLLQIFPLLPLLSSQKLGWDGIYVQSCRLPAWETPEHCSAHHVISVHNSKQAAQAERMLDGHSQNEQISDGEILLLPANVRHRCVWKQEINLIILHIDPKHICRLAHEFINPDQVELIPQFPVPDPLIYQIGLALKSELHSEGLGTRLYAESLFTALGVHLLKKYSTYPLKESAHSLAKRQLQPAVEFINENLDKDLKLAEIAAVVNMSQFYFARMFKQHMGNTPHQYVIQQRVERAKHLLAISHLPVYEVAYQVGFSKQSNFTAHFRRATGVTPKVYRNSL